MDDIKKPVIGITCGDLNGIGMEVIMKTFDNPEILDICTPVIFASSKVASYHRKATNMEAFNFHMTKDFSQITENRPNLVNSWDDEVNIELGKENSAVGEYALKSIEYACKAYEDGKIDAIVTAPIHKTTIQSEAFKFTGHTDYLQNRFGGNAMMLMVSDEMKMALTTVHIPVSKIAGTLKADHITQKILDLTQTLNHDFHISKAKIAVLALNPHAGDNGVIGDEDDRIVAPAIQSANAKGALAFGPFPADSFFGAGKHRQFDAILAMYHDQGLIPFKSLSFGSGVNCTAGLQVIRTSPDHGTGFDIAGQGVANESSFRQAVFLACDLVKARSISKEIHKNPLPIKKGRKEY
jgi:4-hydroxythreonine-4-phosphate dehydrogenase